MKTRQIAILLLLLTISYSISAQVIKPKKTFAEHPKTHNAHICFDGKFYYTVNGGIAADGMINKLDKKGNISATYAIDLDMRTIMYDAGKKVFYVCCYDGNIYEITSLEMGQFRLLHENLYNEKQSSIALSIDGKHFYINNYGTVFVYDVQSGELINTLNNIRCGREVRDGAVSVAVSKEHIYTFDAGLKVIFKYNLDGMFVDSFEYSDGEFAFSLSYANKMVFVATDGNYKMGYWYGYKLK